MPILDSLSYAPTVIPKESVTSTLGPIDINLLIQVSQVLEVSGWE